MKRRVLSCLMALVLALGLLPGTALAANMTNKSFIAAVVGGLGSLEGAVIGSFVLAMGEVMISGYVSSELRDLFSYGLLIAILLIRPRGIMGKRFDDKA